MSWRLAIYIPAIPDAVKYQAFTDDGGPTNPPDVVSNPVHTDPVSGKPATRFVFVVPNQPDGEVIVRTRAVYADGRVGPLSAPLTVTGLDTPVEPEPDPEPEPPPPEPVSTPKWTVKASDPKYYSKGWMDLVWCPTIKRALIVFGHSHNPQGIQTLRLYDPATNSWEEIEPDAVGAKMLNRDNHCLFSIPKRNEVWCVGGSVDPKFGIFDLTTKKWRDISNNPMAIIEGFSLPVRSQGAHGYCEEMDTAVIVMPIEGQDRMDLVIFEPGTTTPYKERKLTGIPLQYGKETHNGGAFLGTDFYVARSRTGGEALNQFAKFNLATSAWTQLKPPPTALYQPVLTADTKRNKLVLHGGSSTRSTAVYDPPSDTWQDITPAMELASDNDGLRPMRNRLRAGCNVPEFDLHLYTGGNAMKDDGVGSWTYSNKVDALQLGEVSTEPGVPGIPTIVTRSWEVNMWNVKVKVAPVQSATKYGAYLDDKNVGEVPQPQAGDVMFDFTFPVDGTHKFGFSAFDANGNESTHPPVNVVGDVFDHLAPPEPGVPEIVMRAWVG